MHGGDTRQQSVANALAQVNPETEIVLVHDAVRPPVMREQVERLVTERRRAALRFWGIPAIDTVKEVKRASLPEDMALISARFRRNEIVLAQTPQDIFLRAAARARSHMAQQDDVNDRVRTKRLWWSGSATMCFVICRARSGTSRLRGLRIWIWRGFIWSRSDEKANA